MPKYPNMDFSRPPKYQTPLSFLHHHITDHSHVMASEVLGPCWSPTEWSFNGTLSQVDFFFCPVKLVFCTHESVRISLVSFSELFMDLVAF